MDKTASGQYGETHVRMGNRRQNLVNLEKGKTMSAIKHYRELKVYQSAMEWTMKVFRLTMSFPDEEKYSLTDQVRRSSRSVCTNIAEAWRKRRYKAAFISKLSDAETEAAETQVHAEIAWRSAYITEAQFQEIDDAYDHILGQIIKMTEQPEKWLIRPHSDA
jgi:four helix bundle protein